MFKTTLINSLIERQVLTAQRYDKNLQKSKSKTIDFSKK